MILDLQALLGFLAGEFEVDSQDLLLGQFADVRFGTHRQDFARLDGGGGRVSHQLADARAAEFDITHCYLLEVA
ncbi:hypothetical protein D3C71_1913990 [compost metagenome]